MSDPFLYEVGQTIVVYDLKKKEPVQVTVLARRTTKNFGNWYKHNNVPGVRPNEIGEQAIWAEKTKALKEQTDDD